MRWVVISTDNNPDYYQYLPIVKKAWNILGWNTLDRKSTRLNSSHTR